MAIKIFEKYGPRANPADADYPHGSIKNESVPGANDGTPLEAAWANDYAGADAALFAEAGITPNGQSDTVGNSQRVEAIKKLAGRRIIEAAVDVATSDLKDGDKIWIEERQAAFDVKAGTANGFDRVNAGGALVAELVNNGMIVSARSLGAVQGADNYAVYHHGINNFQILDGEGVETKLLTTLVVGAGKKLININVKNTTIVDNIISVSSNTLVSGKISGSGLATNSATQIERGVYGVDANDVYLDLYISGVSVAVQSQTSNTTLDSEKAINWRGVLRISDIAGDGSTGGGYGLMLVNTDICQFDIWADNIPRHGLYISAGSSNNEITLRQSGQLKSNAVNVRAEADQNPCINNKITVYASELTATASNVYVAYIGTNSHKNDVITRCSNSIGLSGFIKIEGIGGAGQSNISTPNDNRIEFFCDGQTVGSSVLLLNQRGTTIIDGSTISGGSTDAAQAAVRIQDDSGNPAYSGLSARIGTITLQSNSNTIGVRIGSKGYVKSALSYISGYTSKLVDDTGKFEGVLDKQSGRSLSGVITPGSQSVQSIVFQRQFAANPSVYVSIVNNSVDVNQGVTWVTDVTSSGFTLYIRNTASTDSSYQIQWYAEY